MGDGGDNGLLCHNKHAGFAGTIGPNPHCWHAGPYGWGVCGTQCEDFCTLTVDYCSPDAGYGGALPYDSGTACSAACNGFVNAGTDSGSAVVLEDGAVTFGMGAGASYVGGTFTPPVGGPTTGNSLDCREWHLGVALQSTTLQQTHCSHAAVVSNPCMGAP